MSRVPGRRATGGYPIDVATIDVEHFRRFVDRGAAEEPGGHHRWTGRHDKDGYGIYSVGDPTAGKAVKYRAHRVAYAIAHGGQRRRSGPSGSAGRALVADTGGVGVERQGGVLELQQLALLHLAGGRGWSAPWWPWPRTR